MIARARTEIDLRVTFHRDENGIKVLSRGKIHVIRAIDETPRRWEPGWGVHVEGISVAHPGGKFEWTMRPSRFRPVVDRPTDIEVFKKLLAPPKKPPAKKPVRPVQLRLPL